LLAPTAPTPLSTAVGFEEGAADVDAAYSCGVVIRVPRSQVRPREPRVSGYALARYDGPGVAAYALREHPLAKGWIPIGSAEPAHVMRWVRARARAAVFAGTIPDAGRRVPGYIGFGHGVGS
jgi:hypothetical protein